MHFPKSRLFLVLYLNCEILLNVHVTESELHLSLSRVGLIQNRNNLGKGMFDQHGRFLEERMDPDSGLLDKLLANKTLSKTEYDDIKDHHPLYRRNTQLLDFIEQKKNYDSLISALRDTRQTHLINYLIGNGGRPTSISLYCS